MACDDNCSLRLSLQDPEDPSTSEEIMKRGKWTSYRNFYYADNSYTSADMPENEEIG